MGLFNTMSFRKRSPPTPAAEAEPATAAVVAAAPAAEQPAPSPQAQAEAEQLVRRVGQELPAFLAVAVVEAATGRIVAGQWAGSSGGAVDEAAAHAEMVRQLNLGFAALHLADTEHLADIVITLGHQLHLLRVLPQAGWLLYLAVRAQDTNPALARAVLQAID